MTKLSLFTLFWCVTVCIAVRPELTFHTEPDCMGDALTLQSNKPNLIPEAPRIVSTYKSRSVRGRWCAYGDINYNGFSDRDGGYESSQCYNNTLTQVPVSSIRFLGPPDTTIHGISFYERIDFVGPEILVTGTELSEFPFVPQSLFGSGSTNWTFYTGNNFDGNATCFSPPDLTLDWYYSIYDINDEEPSLSNTRSIRRGCSGHIDKYTH